MTGRPSKYKAKYCRQLIEHMRDGNSFTSFASKIGVHVDTLYEWCEKYSEFSEAKKIAFTAAESFWEDVGRGHAMKGHQAWQFLMKCRFKWRENSETNVVNNEPIRKIFIKRYDDEDESTDGYEEI